jgi:hypothetical protein
MATHDSTFAFRLETVGTHHQSVFQHDPFLLFLQEAGYDSILERLCHAGHPAVSAPTRTEILIVALGKLGDLVKERTRKFLDQQAVATVIWDQDLADAAAAASPATRKDVTPLNRKPGGLMEQSNASLQRGDQG